MQAFMSLIAHMTQLSLCCIITYINALAVQAQA